MSETFADFVPTARDFLARLRANNDRDWFNAHKEEYEATIRRPALLLLETLAPRIADLTGAEVSQKLFRPQRDIRFSADKTPYKDHCHMLWHAPAGTPVGYYFGISPDYVRIGGGVMEFSRGALDRWRRLVDGAEGEAIEAELDRLKARGCEVSEPQLSRVPAPYDKDHPHAALLRHKSLTVWRDEALPIGHLPECLMQTFSDFAPLCNRLAAAV